MYFFHQALNELDKSSIEELRRYKKPPPLICSVGEAVCVVFGVLPSWKNFLKLMLNLNEFSNRLVQYDLNSFPIESYSRLTGYVRTKNFNAEYCDFISLACSGLCKWYEKNIYNYIFLM